MDNKFHSVVGILFLTSITAAALAAIALMVATNSGKP